MFGQILVTLLTVIASPLDMYLDDSVSLTSRQTGLKVQMKCFFIAEFERAAKIRKIAVYCFLISVLVPEL